MRRRVTFSRNVTLSLSRTCVSHCKYCAFATHRPHLHEPDEVERLIDRAARRGVKELLVLTGDDPAHVPGVGERLAELGFDGLRRLRRVVLRARARARAAAAHEPRRAGPRGPRAAARGDGVAGADARVDARRTSSRTRRRRRRTRRCGWRRSARRASCGSRSRAGSSSGSARRAEDRVAALEALAAVHAEHGHLQEVILQNFVPHRRYYGEEPADIATEAAEAYWRSGPARGPRRARARRGRRR